MVVVLAGMIPEDAVDLRSQISISLEDCNHTYLFKLGFSQSYQLPVPVEKDLRIETSWSLIHLMSISIAAIMLNNPSLSSLKHYI